MLNRATTVEYYIEADAAGFRIVSGEGQQRKVEHDSGPRYRGTDPWELAEIGYAKHCDPDNYKRGPKHQPKRRDYAGVRLYNA